ncbi:MAG: hypothetical protein HY826_10650 [Actinobacteria bacterium]|nr:hypothetical protein [Actinomycetota bacterium]
MTVERLTISLEAELAEAIRVAAEADAENISSWIAEASRRRLSQRGLRAVIRDWENEHGEITAEEMAAARKRLYG